MKWLSLMNNYINIGPALTRIEKHIGGVGTRSRKNFPNNFKMDLKEAQYLVLEDNKNDQLLLLRVMDKIGIPLENIICSPAIAGIPDKPFDFVLCDLNLSDSAELDTVRSMHSRFPDAVLIVLTGYEDEELAIEAIHMGAQDYIVKGKFDEPLLKKTLLFARERNRLVIQARESEARFRGLIEHNYCAICIMDEETTISYASTSIISVLGYAPEDIIGKRIVDILHPEDIPRRAGLFKDLLGKKGCAAAIKERILNKKGEYVWVEATISDHRDIPGIRGMVSNIKNIDQEEKALEQLRQSEKRLVEITNTIPGAILRYQLFPNGSDKLIYVSQGQEEMWGVPREEAISDVSKIWNRIHPEDVQSLKDSVLKSFMDLSIWNHRFRISIKDESLRWVTCIGTPSRQPDGSVIWDTITFDVSQQMELEQALKAHHERFELVGKATNDAIWDWNLKTNKLYCGEGFGKLFGLEMDNGFMDFEFWSGQIHPLDRERVVKGIETRLENSGDNIWRDEFRFMKADGGVAFVDCRAYIIFNELDEPLRMVGAMHDVTEKITLVNSVNEKNHELSCLFSISQLINDPTKPLLEIMNEIVHVLPISSKYPGIVSCRIKLYQQTFTSIGFTGGAWSKKATIKSNGKSIGTVELCYPPGDMVGESKQLLFEERKLIDTIAKMLGSMIEKREAEERLVQERMLLRTVIDNILDRIYVKDTNLEYVISNKANIDFIGAENEQDILGKVCMELFGGCSCHQDDCQVLGEGKTVVTSEHYVTSKTGITRRFHTTKVPIKDGLGDVVGLVGISRDITQSKKDEEKLLKSEFNLKAIFNNIDAGYALLDWEYSILSINTKAVEFFENFAGLTYHVGNNFLEKMAKRQQQYFQHHLDAVSSNQTVVFEEQYTKDSKTGWFKITIMPVNVNSQVIGASIGIYNITAIKEAELNLKKTAANMKALLNSTDDAYILIDKDLLIKSYNDQAVRNTRFMQIKEIKTGENILDYVPEPREATKLAITKALSGEKTEYVVNDEEFYWQIIVYPIVFDNTEIQEVSMLIRNVTARKLSEQELILQQELLLNSQELANLGSFEWDLQTDDFNATGEFFQLFGIDHESENIKDDFFSKIHNSDRIFVLKVFKDATKMKNPFNVEFKTVPIDETEKYIRGKCVIHKNGDKSTRMFCALQDITEQKTASQAMLVGQELERRRLAKDLHDGVGQLLTGTKFMLEALDNSNKDQAKQLDGVKELLATTIREVRNITKSLSTKTLEQQGLKAAIEQLCKPFKYNSIQVDMDYQLCGEPEQKLQLAMYRILQEAINNVIKHACASHIGIRLFEKEDHVLLEITDNGIGYDTNNIINGNGHGLLNIRERVDLFRGSLKIYSRINEGTRILCRFPK